MNSKLTPLLLGLLAFLALSAFAPSPPANRVESGFFVDQQTGQWQQVIPPIPQGVVFVLTDIWSVGDYPNANEQFGLLPAGGGLHETVTKREAGNALHLTSGVTMNTGDSLEFFNAGTGTPRWGWCGHWERR